MAAGRGAVCIAFSRRPDDLADIVDGDNAGVPAPSLILVVHDRGNSNDAATGAEDRSASAAGRQPEVGDAGMRLDADHLSK